MKLKIAVCDYELQTLNQEYEIINSVLKSKGLNYDIDKFNSSNDLFNACIPYNIAFLDIEMYGVDGIKLARRLKEFNKNCLLFFITNYAVYLDNALDLNAFRYLPKPVDVQRLSSGIDIAIKKIRGCSKSLRVTRFESKLKMDLKILDIIYIENSSRHTRIVTRDYNFIAKETFSELKSVIEKEVNYFAEANQSVFVNLNYINRYENSKVMLKYAYKDYEFNVSRRKHKAFMEKLFEFGKELK